MRVFDEYFWESGWGISTIIISFMLAIVVLTSGIVAAINYLSFPGTLVQIEQLRRDAAHVNPIEAEAIYGQVVETNQNIKYNQYYNKQWWSGWTIPDGWDQIQVIQVQRGQ